MNEFDYEEFDENELDTPSDLELSLRARFMRRYGRERTAHAIASAIIRHLDEFPNGLASRDVIDVFVWFYRCVYGHGNGSYATYHLDDTRAFHAALQRVGRRARRAVIACLGDLRWSFVKSRATRKLRKERDDASFDRSRRKMKRSMLRLGRRYPDFASFPDESTS